MDLSSISVIIPVYHEEDSINWTIKALKSLDMSKILEIIVVDGDEKGSTIKTISGENIIKIISKKGRGAQMNAGAKVAKGEILLFLHADTQLPQKALIYINNVIHDKKYRVGAFDLSFDSKKWIFRLIAFVDYYRAHLYKLPYGDQAIFITKELFESIGGYNEYPLMEDIDIIKRIKKKKNKIYFIDDSVKTAARRFEKEGVAYGLIRNFILLNLFFLGVSPEKLYPYYKDN